MRSRYMLGVLSASALLLTAGSRTALSEETTASADSSDQLTEVVVTAERRSENLQKVPISVSVVSAEEAAKFGNMDNLSLGTQIPSFMASRQLTGATIYLRGIGTIAAAGEENAVASYIDDVYINGFSGTIVPFEDIDHVEVLKGPQGTLFGRNATGGVINTITRDPSSDPSLMVKLGYGNFRTVSSNVYGTTGLGHDLAVNVSAMFRRQYDGYGHDLTTGLPIYLGKEWGFRSKLKWTPSEATSITLAADYYYDDYDYAINGTAVPGTLAAGGTGFAGNYNSYDGEILSPNHQGGHGRRIEGESINARHEFNWGEIKSISARREVRDATYFDQDATAVAIVDAYWPSRTEQYSEELHVSSLPGAKLLGHDVTWLAGVFYFKMNDGIRPLQIAGAAIGGLDYFGATSVNYTTSHSEFFDASFAFTPETKLTVGARITADRIRNEGNLNIVAAGVRTITPIPAQHADATQPTYRVVLEHNFTDDLMAYAGVSRGFKSGGFGLFSAGSAPVKPEFLRAATAGVKSEWLSRRLQANFEGFYYDYANQQVEVDRAGNAFYVNAARSHIYGAELNLTALPVRDLTLRGNFGYLHGRYQKWQDAPVYLQAPASCVGTPHELPGPIVPGNIACAFDASGYPTIRSPTFSGNVGTDYTLHVGGGTVNTGVNYSYTTSYNWDPSGQFPEHAYGLLSGAITWAPGSAAYDVQIYCANCTNKYHHAYIGENAVAMMQAGADPRTYGVRFGFYF